MTSSRIAGIGIDFGTSNSTVAWFDGERVHTLQLEAGSTTMPTAVHIDRQYEALVGGRAIERYVEENRARRVELTAKPIGEAAFDVRESFGQSQEEDGDQRAQLYGPVDDYNMPGRLFLGLKRLLGQAEPDRISVFGRPFRLVALLTPIFLKFQDAIGPELLAQAPRIYLGRPVRFEGHDETGNRMATERLAEAAGHASLGKVEFYPEPVAACLSFLAQNPISHKCTVLTVDFGGGTLDLSVVSWDGVQFQVLDTEGAAIGGDHMDELIFREMIFPELGKGVSWTRSGDRRELTTPFPFHLYEEGLLNWAITHTLNQNEYTARLAEYLAQGGEESAKIRRLRDTIVSNASYDIIRAIRAAKARLSDEEATTLDIPELDLALPLSRARLNDIIRPVISVVRSQVENLLSRNGLPSDSIDFVVRTGGSCQLKAVIDLLEGTFPGKVVEHDTFTGVANGLAIASYHGYRFALADAED